MQTNLTPLTITIAQSRLTGFQFLANDLGFDIESLIASRVFTEFTIPENFALSKLKTYSEGLPDERVTITLHFDQRAMALIKEVSGLLRQEMAELSGSLADLAGELVNSVIEDHLHGRVTDADFRYHKDEAEEFSLTMKRGYQRGEFWSRAWKEVGLQPIPS